MSLTTPRPWRVSYDRGYFIEAEAKDQIGRICTISAEGRAGRANAILIVTYVNMHDVLVAAVKKYYDVSDECRDLIDRLEGRKP